MWRDTSQVWQEEDFGGEPNLEPVNLRARNRLELLEAGHGSLAIFPPPHKFFFARENEVNLGYVYYRKDSRQLAFSSASCSPNTARGYAPWGISDAVWKRRSNTAREQIENYALYNAPPGTLQRMAVYFYLSPNGNTKPRKRSSPTRMTTSFKPVPGFKTVTGHFHLELNEMARDRATPRPQPHMGARLPRSRNQYRLPGQDFHDDSDIHDPGVKRLGEQKLYFEASRRLSDKIFLVIPRRRSE